VRRFRALSISATPTGGAHSLCADPSRPVHYPGSFGDRALDLPRAMEFRDWHWWPGRKSWFNLKRWFFFRGQRVLALQPLAQLLGKRIARLAGWAGQSRPFLDNVIEPAEVADPGLAILLLG
jgi:hypothetical protein